MAKHVLCRYRFQPVENNPYLMIPEDEEEVDEELQVPTAATTIPLNEPCEKMATV